MANNYRINLVNNSPDMQTFWCFLERPSELVSDPNVFANSSASLEIASNSPGHNAFIVPLQFQVGVGASNNAVGLNVVVVSDTTLSAGINQNFNATYYNAPPNRGPDLAQSGTASGPQAINIKTNPFNKSSNAGADWFANQSFGIETAQGFIGMTWSPEPNQTRVLTPLFSFYISVGDYGSNTLAQWNDFANSAQAVTLANFTNNQATVTYNQDGSWSLS